MMFAGMKGIRRTAVYYGLGGGAIIVAAGIAYYFFWSPPTTMPTQVGEQKFVNLSITKGIEDCATYVKQEGSGPNAYLCVKNNREIVLAWSNLPDTTTEITIFRQQEDGDALVSWKTISVSGSSGELVLQTGTMGEDFKTEFSGYSFYIEAAIGNDVSHSTSTPASTPSSTPALPTSTPLISTLPPPVSGPTSTASTSSPQAPTSTPPTPTSTPTSTPTQPPASTSTEVQYYYSPDGQVSSANPPPAAPHFWVQHVNKKIEIGWNTLPAGTVQIVVSRSDGADGPWSQLLLQNNPITTNYVIRLVDNTIGEAYYYKLDANGGGATLATYGPELLPPLAE